MPQNLRKTLTGWQYRKVIPADVRAALGKREIKRTLNNDYRSAREEAAVLEVQAIRLIADARATNSAKVAAAGNLESYLTTAPDKRLTPITALTPELGGQVSALWLAGLQSDLDWRRLGVSDAEYEDLSANIAEMQAMIGRALATGQVQSFFPAVANLLAGKGYLLALNEADTRRLTYEVLQAFQAGYKVLADRQKGELTVPDTRNLPTPLPATWEPPVASTTKGPSWDELLANWKVDKTRANQTEYEAKQFLDSFKLHVKKMPSEVVKADVTSFLRNERLTRGNAASTLKKRGGLLGAIFSVATKDELLEANPFDGYDYGRFASKEGIADTSRRVPLAPDDLKKIF